MTRSTPFLSAFLAAFLVAATASAELREISWGTLAPAPAQYENPFKSLTSDQMDGLRRLLRLQARVDAKEAGAADKAAELRAQLENEGLDVDSLFTQRLNIMKRREAASRATNDDVLGQDVRLPGYVLPLEFKDRKVVEFLLVPTVGACIHTPPPPANQMVHVRYPEGIKVNGLYDPVWISGKMLAEFSQQTVRYVDGQTKIEVTYAMEPDLVEPY